MNARGGLAGEYTVPTYRAPDDAVWYHFLYGSVPGHQIDLILRPELPHGALAPQHFSHLLRLVKYIEPRDGARFAFAIGHLSRDDTQHVPGHGGLALIIGLRVRGATDHTGRPAPPFSHAIAAVDRELDAGAIEAACASFHRHMMGGAGHASDGAAFYRAYAAARTERSAEEEALVARYIASFSDLPRPARSHLTQAFRTEGHGRAERVVIVHPDGAPFSEIALCAARLASILYRCDVRWTSITTGREADIPNGVSIRLVPERDAHGSEVAGALVLGLDEIPRDDAEAAHKLFGASPVEHRPRISGRAEGWRGGFTEANAEARAVLPAEDAPPKDRQDAERAEAPPPAVFDEATTQVMPALEAPPLPVEPDRPRPRSKRWGYIFTGIAMGVAALLWIYQARDVRATVLAPILLAPVESEDVGPRPALADNDGAPAQRIQRPREEPGSTAQASADLSPPAARPSARAPVGRRNVSVPATARREEPRPDDGALLFPSLPDRKGSPAPE